MCFFFFVWEVTLPFVSTDTNLRYASLPHVPAVLSLSYWPGVYRLPEVPELRHHSI